MPHYEYMEFTLDDGSQVRLEPAPPGTPRITALLPTLSATWQLPRTRRS
ncbi:hypothetical protein ACIQNU_37865 [Streptomyces sp. NPDC091292]